MYINLPVVLPKYLSPVSICKYVAKAKVPSIHDLNFPNDFIHPHFLMLQFFEAKSSFWTIVDLNLISKVNKGGTLYIFGARKVFGLPAKAYMNSPILKGHRK